MYIQYFIIFSIIFTGYVLKKVKIINSDMNNSLNRLIVYFAYPCLIFLTTVNSSIDFSLAVGFIKVLVLSLCFFIGYSLLAKFYCKIRKFPSSSVDVAELAMGLPNNGFIGFPVAQIFFGSEALLLMIANNTAMNLFIFSYGLVLLRNENGQSAKFSLRLLWKSSFQFFTNPNIVAISLGFIVSYYHIPLPDFLYQYIGYFSAIAIPMALVFIGSSLEEF